MFSAIATGSRARTLLIWGLVLEFPLRYLIFPDPWLHEADHWYFIQPTRLMIEVAFVVAAFVPFLCVDELRALTTTRLDRRQLLYLVFGVPVALGLFGVTEWSEIEAIQRGDLWSQVPVWFVTGLFIGVGQELTFRGLIFTGVKSSAGTRMAVVISTALFVVGSLHGPRMYAYATSGFTSEALVLLGVFTATGLTFTRVRTRTRHVLVPALLHGFGNAVKWGTVFVIKLHS